MDSIKVFALGGLDENGRDCYIVEINNNIFVLDCGISIPDKTVPGIDALLPNLSYLKANKSRVCAYIMTHGHDENMSGLMYIYKDVPAPIYTTKETMRCINGQALIKKVATKFNYIEVQPNDTLTISGYKIDLFQTCHNAGSSFGVVIHTDQGNIVYSGDFIVDFTTGDDQFYFNVKKLEKLSEEPTLLLMAESKAANKEGYCSPNHRVTKLISKYFQEDKRIFICSFWQNVFRIKEILNLVRDNHKKLYFYNDYTRQIISFLFPDLSLLGIKNEDVLSKEDILRHRKQDMVILMLGHGKELYEEISLIAKKENADKRIEINEDDIFINCALATTTYEIISTRSMDTLYRVGCNVIWLKKNDTSSMHARQDDLKFFISCLKPKYYLPVRGSFTELMANAKLALSMNIGLNHNNVFVLDNGMQLTFNASKLVAITNAEQNGLDVSPVVVDGTGIGKIATDIIEDRVKLSVDGVVVIAATISHSSRSIVAGPDCQMRGFVFVKEAEPLLKSITQIYIDEINAVLLKGSFNFDLAIETIKDRCKKFIKRENGREPLVMPIVIQID